jgi:DinB superfamily
MTTEAEYAERRARLLGPMEGLTDSALKLAVREACGKLATTLDSFSDRQATWKPDAEEWSAAQVGDHIALGTAVLGKIAGLLAKGQTVTDEDWDPPPQFKGDPADLSGVKKRIAELPEFTDRLFDESVQTNRLDLRANNSFLGDMNWREWFYFLRVHAYAHVEQMEKLRSARGFPS